MFILKRARVKILENAFKYALYFILCENTLTIAQLLVLWWMLTNNHNFVIQINKSAHLLAGVFWGRSGSSFCIWGFHNDFASSWF